MIQKKNGDSKIVAHARRELEMAGTFTKTADYDGSIGRGILAMIKLFDSWSRGRQAEMEAMAMGFNQLINGELMSPPTTDPDEWQTVEGAPEGTVRNKRCPWYMSQDGGKTWMHLQNKEKGASKKYVKESTDEARNTNIPTDQTEGSDTDGGNSGEVTEQERTTEATDKSGPEVSGSELKTNMVEESSEDQSQQKSTSPKPKVGTDS